MPLLIPLDLIEPIEKSRDEICDHGHNGMGWCDKPAIAKLVTEWYAAIYVCADHFPWFPTGGEDWLHD